MKRSASEEGFDKAALYRDALKFACINIETLHQNKGLDSEVFRPIVYEGSNRIRVHVLLNAMDGPYWTFQVKSDVLQALRMIETVLPVYSFANLCEEAKERAFKDVTWDLLADYIEEIQKKKQLVSDDSDFEDIFDDLIPIGDEIFDPELEDGEIVD